MAMPLHEARRKVSVPKGQSNPVCPWSCSQRLTGDRHDLAMLSCMQSNQLPTPLTRQFQHDGAAPNHWLLYSSVEIEFTSSCLQFVLHCYCYSSCWFGDTALAKGETEMKYVRGSKTIPFSCWSFSTLLHMCFPKAEVTYHCIQTPGFCRLCRTYLVHTYLQLGVCRKDWNQSSAWLAFNFPHKYLFLVQINVKLIKTNALRAYISLHYCSSPEKM